MAYEGIKLKAKIKLVKKILKHQRIDRAHAHAQNDFIRYFELDAVVKDSENILARLESEYRKEEV